MAWRWQLGSQNGQYQLSDSEPNPDTHIISKFNTWDVIARYVCHTMRPYAPEKPDIMAIKKYGGWKMQPGNVMWTDGEWDPWTLRVHSEGKINLRGRWIGGGR